MSRSWAQKAAVAPERRQSHKTGQVIEFVDREIEQLQEAIARRLGYKLVEHRLELYAMPIDD